MVLTRRQQGMVYPGNNQKAIVQLHKSHLYREMMIRLTGAPTLLAANNTVANTKKGDEWGALKLIQIIANSSDVLFSMTGDQLWWFNRQQTGNNPKITAAIGDAATANVPFDSSLIIPFWSYRSAKPFDTALDSGMFTDFRIEATFGTFTDVNSAATAWTTNPAVEIGSHESEAGGYEPPLFSRVIASSLAVSGATQAFRFPLDVGPAYQSFLINGTTTAGVDTAGLITNVKVVSGSTIFHDISEPMLREWGTLRSDVPFNIEKATTGIATQTNPRISGENSPLAWYDLNLCTDGRMGEAINTANFNEFYLEFTTSAACTINVVSKQLLPIALINKMKRKAA